VIKVASSFNSGICRKAICYVHGEEVLTVNSIIINPYARTCADAAWVSVALGAAALTQ
jgi:hypothetical protein